MKKRISKKDRLLEKPKYKIGDVVVYYDTDVPMSNAITQLCQDVITGAIAYIDLDKKDDHLEWYYTTGKIEDDNIYEDDILYKL